MMLDVPRLLAGPLECGREEGNYYVTVF